MIIGPRETLERLIRDFCLADDVAFVAFTERLFQRIISCFTEAVELFGLEANLKKTKLLHQPAPREEYRSPSTTIDTTQLKAAHLLTYLRCTITPSAKIDKEINWLSKASCTFGKL